MSTEHPIFVPHEDATLAAIVTVPDAAPRGIVLLLQGQGAAFRANKYRLWTRLARKLGDRGIGALRMDLPGTGDSTGSRPSAVDDLSTGQAKAVLDVAMEILGVDVFGLAGHCYGAEAFFELGEDERAGGAAFLLFADPRYMVAQPGAEAARPPVPRGPAGQPAWKQRVRSLPGMKDVLRARRIRRRRRLPWPVEFVRLVERTPALFLPLRPERAAREVEHAVGLLARRVPSASIDCEAVFHNGGLARMPHQVQEDVLDVMADWFDKVLPAAAQASRAAEAPVPVGAE